MRKFVLRFILSFFLWSVIHVPLNQSQVRIYNRLAARLLIGTCKNGSDWSHGVPVNPDKNTYNIFHFILNDSKTNYKIVYEYEIHRRYILVIHYNVILLIFVYRFE